MLRRKPLQHVMAFLSFVNWEAKQDGQRPKRNENRERRRETRQDTKCAFVKCTWRCFVDFRAYYPSADQRLISVLFAVVSRLWAQLSLVQPIRNNFWNSPTCWPQKKEFLKPKIIVLVIRITIGCRFIKSPAEADEKMIFAEHWSKMMNMPLNTQNFFLFNHIFEVGR